MDRAEYFRYHSQLMSTGSVDFPKREKLIDFVAEMIADDYASYCTFSEMAAVTPADREVWSRRKEAERYLVRLYATQYLQKRVASLDNIVYIASVKLWKKIPKSFIWNFDAENENEIYAYVLGKLGQSDKPEDVFVTKIRYTVEGHLVFKRKSI